MSAYSDIKGMINKGCREIRVDSQELILDSVERTNTNLLQNDWPTDVGEKTIWGVGHWPLRYLFCICP